MVAIVPAGQTRRPDNEQATRRVARLLDLVWRIAYAPRAWDRRRLATLYEVSERQITKDLDLLRNGLGFDIRAGAGGYQFERAPHLLIRPPRRGEP